MVFHNLLADREAYAGARILPPRMKTLKYNEYTGRKLRSKPYPVIFNRKNPFIPFPFGRNMNPRFFFAAEQSFL
jgi:hypothetical protein